MKLHWHSILPFGFVLGGGMAVGSVHNAMARDVIPAPMGYIFMGLVALDIIAGLIISRYYENLPSVGFWGAFGWAMYVAIGGAYNVVTTLSAPQVDPMLVHEWLLPAVGIIQVVKLLVEKFTGFNPKA